MTRKDLSGTPRKALTPSQRLKLFEAHGGICCLCVATAFSEPTWIDEHLRPLWGSGAAMTTTIAAPRICAAQAYKTPADLRRIAKAKAQKKAQLGIRPPARQVIPSRPFASSVKAWRAPSPLGPPRPIYREDCGRGDE